MNIPTQNPTKLKAIERLNKEFGKDIKNLSKVNKIKTQLINEKQNALKQLELDLDNVENETKIKNTVNQLNNNVNNIVRLNTEFEHFSTDAIQYLGTTNDIVKHLQEYVHQIESLEIIIEYFNISKKIQNISSELYQSIIDHDDELSVTLYANLCEIAFNLQGCPATHLLIYLKDVIHHWHNYLKDKFSIVFDEILKTIKWPFVNTNITLSPMTLSSNIMKNSESIIKFQTYCEYLLQIQLPSITGGIGVGVDSTTTSSLCLPIILLIRPLKKRFIYHFYGNKQTNRSDKPEWYITQILTWIRDHEEFIKKIVQPVIDRLAMHHINARLEFINGLIQICCDKLDHDLPTLSYDDALFSHCVDETLGMDRELRTLYHLPQTHAGCLTSLTNPIILQKWLNMEKKYALEKMDTIFKSSTALNNVIMNNDNDNGVVIDDDDIKITECSNIFITLLKTMNERYQSLPQPGHRLQFLDLQLDLLDDFRIRLLQLSHHQDITLNSTTNSTSRRLSYILNTIYFIIDTLNEWSETIHFINLYYFKNQFTKQYNITTSDNTDENGTVFDETISLYTHMKNDLISILTETIVLDVKARSRAYRHDSCWNTSHDNHSSNSNTITNNDNNEKHSLLSLTSSGCPMYQILATHLHELNELLTTQIFNHIYKCISKQLNTFMYDELILQNYFNNDGARQLSYDINFNLIPLFGQYSNTKLYLNYFKNIIEACALLTLSKSTAILLMDTLENNNNDKNGGGVAALNELGVHKLNIDEAVQILKLRTDLRHF